MSGPLPAVPSLPALGSSLYSPGLHFRYRVIGPVCRLFDREELPWPCCSLSWRGKQPSWRRVGRRLVLDQATYKHPSYSVLLDDKPLVVTFFSVQLSADECQWWYSKKP
ncbi:hypothetical protein [Leptolyngbya sp. FACHB-261]|uniref:hypothetical protein n=1 Tax=Leptolyngbya sp. FACHB-261 TaxID=2692806 RepID=UPI001686D6D1|nr:hypothetical protein [Leptolyngbya sp. FACHB-261]MBD2099852.1 hypothetical protein [Leptolyngbya sp. FACHB-261]